MPSCLNRDVASAGDDEKPMPPRLVGRGIVPATSEALVQGMGEYIQDIVFPGLLEIAFLRSYAAHGTIKFVNTSKARSLNGVLGVVTSDDIVGLAQIRPPVNMGYSPPRSLLAGDRVRFVGEPIACVVAEDRYYAEDARDVIELGLDDLPAVIDPEYAASSSAPKLHPPHGNVLFEEHFRVGDVDNAFSSAHRVLEARFRSSRVHAVPIETRGAIAVPTDKGVRVWSSTQVPHLARALIAECLGRSLPEVEVCCPAVGGGFGLKAHVYPEEVLVAYLALRYQRPVRWIEDRTENLQAASHARDQIIDVKVGVTEDGHVSGLEADVLCDVGAYGVWPHGHALEANGTPTLLPGPYKIANLAYRTRSIATNKCPEGAYRGVGLPVAAFVHERIMDMVSRSLQRDRVEIRLANMVRREEMPYRSCTGLLYDSGDYRAALERALARADCAHYPARARASRSRGLLRGLGIAVALEWTGVGSHVFQSRGMYGIPGYDEVRIQLMSDGSASVWTSLPSSGQGLETSFAQLVADALALEFSQVQVHPVDTTTVSNGNGTFASRSAISGGGALIQASQAILEEVLAAGAEYLETSENDLYVRGGRVIIRGAPERDISFGELVKAAPARFNVTRRYDPPVSAFPYAAHVCEVEVDRALGRVSIDRYVVVEDCGPMINPTIVDGQLRGAVVQGLGEALLERFVYDADGQPLTSSLVDYLVPVAGDIPDIEIEHLETAAVGLIGPFKGVGEAGLIPVPACITGAVSDALGKEVTEIPVSVESLTAASVSVSSS
jgi:carbon-monoxide dehydrogenase large subunit